MAAPDPGPESQRTLLVTVLAGVLAFLLGCLGLGLSLGVHGVGDLVDIAYRALQLFVLDGGALSGRDSDQPLEMNPVLEVARFLAPLVTIGAVLVGLRQLFAESRRNSRIAKLTKHILVYGDNPSARVLAQHLHDDGRDVVLLADPAPAGVRFLTLPGDPRNGAVLEAAGIVGATALYACDDDSAANAAVALAALALCRDRGKPLQAFAQVRSDRLAEALRLRQVAAGRVDNSRLGFFNLDEIAARALLERHPVGSDTPVVLGFGRTGQAVVRAIIRGAGAVPARRLVVVGADRTRVADEAAELRADERGWSVEAGPVEAATGILYVCLDDEEAALASGLRCAADRHGTVVVCLRRASPFREALGSADGVQIFGLLDEACRLEAIEADSIVDRAARTIHEIYRRDASQRGESPATNASLVPWSDLPEHLKESNYAQVEHMGRKLHEIGAVLVTQRPAAEFSFSDDEVNRLAQLEHVRWMNERLAAGYTWGPRREGRSHPDLVDWPNLPPDSRQKDVEAVRKLPEVLAVDGIYIVRRPPSSPDGR